MSYKISYSSEVMTGYLQGEVIAPDKKFQAIQNENGNSLLFSVGTDAVFYVTEEIVATDQNNSESSTGWKKTDLSSSLLEFFPTESSIKVNTFDVSQDLESGKYSVAVAVTVSENDYLFMATSYSRNEEGNLVLEWKAIPFDATGKSYTSIAINGIYILQTPNLPMVVIDIVPNGKTTTERYYIDSTQAAQDKYWYYYPLPFNLDSESVDLCAGRKDGEAIDGIYTCGTAGDNYSVYYQPLLNQSNLSQPAAVSQLIFEEAATPKRIASTTSVQKGSVYTDLYVATDEGDLYLFSSGNQHNNSYGQKILNSQLLIGTRELFAYTTNSKVVVWGINRNKEIFYTESDITSNKNLSEWTVPLPIATGVELISPYVNKINGGNTYFADLGNNQLRKVSQDPTTSCWLSESILLPLDADASSTSFDCYMTRLSVTDDSNTVAPNINVKITAKSRVATYINNHYYILEPSLPITVPTDNSGGIKVVQKIENLQGIGLIFESEGGQVLEVNPMDTSAQKIATLNSADNLKNAEVVSDGGTTTGSLVDSGLEESDYTAAADSIQSLIDSYNNYNTSSTVDASPKQSISLASYKYSPTARIHQLHVSLGKTTQLSVISDIGDSLEDLGNAIVVKAGDLCSWLKSATEYVIQVVEDAANKVWNFVVTIAGEIFTFVIDCVEKAIEALMAVLQALGTLIKDLIQFVKFLFSWGDITLTKDVLKNSIKLYLDSCISSVADLEASVVDTLSDIESKMDDWANIPTSTAGSQTLAESQASNTDEVYTTPNTYLPDYFTANINNAKFKGADLVISGLEAIVTAFVEALEGEKDVVEGAVAQLKASLLDNDQYKNMSFVDILKTVLAIVTDAVLGTAEVVLDATVTLIEGVYNALMDYLDTPIWIPVISDLMEALFDYEISLSLLDIFCYLGAVPGTLIYKVLNNKAPFSEDDPDTQKIISCTSIDELVSYFGSTAPDSIDLSKEFYSDIQIPQGGKDTLYFTFHAASSAGALVYAVLAPTADLLAISPLIVATSLASATKTLGFTAAGIFAKPYPIQDKTIANLSSLITDTSILSSLVFGVVEKKESIAIPAKYAKGVLDIVLSMLAVAPIAYHFYELLEGDQNKFTALAYLDDSARLTNYVSSIAGGIAAIDPEPSTSEIMALTSSICAAINGGIQLGACAVDAFVDV